MYRLVVIEGLEKYPRVYKFGNGLTDQGLRVKYVNSTKVFRLNLLSDSALEDREFNRWRVEMLRAKKPLYSQGREVAEYYGKLQEALIAPITEDEVNHMLKEKQRFQDLRKTRNLREERIKLKALIEIAKSDKDDEKRKELEVELDALEKEILEQKMANADERLEALTEINKRNRLNNHNVIREAELKFRANKRATEALQVLDPFARRKCNSETFHALPDEDDEEVEAAKKEEEKTAAQAAESQSELPAEDSKPRDLFSAHSFELDIEI